MGFDDKNTGLAPHEWTHRLCEFVWPISCYACCFPSFVFGRARRWHDGTNTLFNCLFVMMPIAQQIIRMENHIDGSASTDCVQGSFFCPCSSVRSYREAIVRAPKVPQFDPSNRWGTDLMDCLKGPHGQNCFVTFCLPCAMARSRKVLDDSSFWLNLFCLTPCAYRNIVRRSYNIKGTHCGDSLIWCVPVLGCMDACRTYRTVMASGAASQRHRRAGELRRWAMVTNRQQMEVAADGRLVPADAEEALPFDSPYDRDRNLTYGPELVCGQITETGSRCLCRVSQDELRRRAIRGQDPQCVCGHAAHLHPTERVLAATVGPGKRGIPPSLKEPYEGGLIVTELRHPEARNDVYGGISDLPGMEIAGDQIQH